MNFNANALFALFAAASIATVANCAEAAKSTYEKIEIQYPDIHVATTSVNGLFTQLTYGDSGKLEELTGFDKAGKLSKYNACFKKTVSAVAASLKPMWTTGPFLSDGENYEAAFVRHAAAYLNMPEGEDTSFDDILTKMNAWAVAKSPEQLVAPPAEEAEGSEPKKLSVKDMKKRAKECYTAYEAIQNRPKDFFDCAIHVDYSIGMTKTTGFLLAILALLAGSAAGFFAAVYRLKQIGSTVRQSIAEKA